MASARAPSLRTLRGLPRLLAAAMAAASFLSVNVVACSSQQSEPFDAGSSPGGSGAGGAAGGDAGTGDRATVPSNVSWCPSAPPAAGCKRLDICGVCVPQPSADLKRTSDAREYSKSGPPDVACLEKGAKLKPLEKAKSRKVTMEGYAKIFANGPDSKNVRIQVYEQDIATGKIGTAPLAETVSDPRLPGGTKVETIRKGGTEISRTLYPYKVDGVPTETPLVVKTSGKSDADGWFALYDYNVVARNDDVPEGKPFTFDVRALGNDDYASILKAAYGRPPEGGQSVIAGEVHDCGDVRLSNATVQIAPTSSLGLVYLSDVEDDPLPDSQLKATNRLGLYAVGGLTPGRYKVAAAGRVGGQIKALGSYEVDTFPNSVTVYTFRGLRSWQLP